MINRMYQMRWVMLWIAVWSCLFSPAQQSEVTEQEVEPTVNSPMWTTFPSAVIAGLGVIFNLISLSYFIRREYDSLGKYNVGKFEILLYCS